MRGNRWFSLFRPAAVFIFANALAAPEGSRELSLAPMQTARIAALAALFLTLLWLLSPSRSLQEAEPGVVELTYMRETGLFTDAVSDALRAFEEESRAAHAADRRKPIYRVISGQNASRNQTEDPTRFLVSVAGGAPPDVIRFDRFAVTEWAARGAFQQLDDFIARDQKAHHRDAFRSEEFYRAAWAEVVFKNPRTGARGVFGVPEKLDNRALYYNKDLLKRAGFVDERGEARPPRTWDDLEKMAVALTEHDADGRIARLGFAPNFGNAWLYMYGFANGGKFMSDDGRRTLLNSPEIVAALEYMSRIYDAVGGAGRVEAFQSLTGAQDLDPFLAGKVALKIDGAWFLDTLGRYGRDLSYGVAPPPMPQAELDKGRQPISWVSGWCHAMPSTARHKEGAWELMRFLATPRANAIIAGSSRIVAESQGRLYIPDQHSRIAINEWLFKTYVDQNPLVPRELADGCRLFNSLIEPSPFRPVTPVGQVLWNQQRDQTDNALFHKATPRQALDQGAENVQRELDRVLSPPRGRIMSLPWLVVVYVALLCVAVVAVFLWDTRPAFQRGFKQAFKPWKTILASNAALEGTHSSYFRSQWAGGWLCALPWLIGFVVFTGGPIFFSIIMSLSDYDILNPPRFIGPENYVWMFTRDPLFWKSLWNTLYMVIGIPLGMALSLGIALLLNLEIRGVALWRTLFYLPSIVPAVASSILWLWILNPNAGLLNNVLASAGLHGPNWLHDEHTSKISLILMGLWSAGGGMIIWIAGLKGISTTYYEAAEIDGASAWQKFRHVTVPLLSPYIFFNLIMGLIGTFQIFTQAFIMTEGGPVNSTLFYAYYLFNNAFRYLHMGYACAMGWVLFVIVFALTLLQMRLSQRWVHYEN